MNDLVAVIQRVLKKHPVEFAYLFGSQASGKARKASDVDIAVYAREALSAEERFNLRLKLSAELTAALHKQADVLIMNDAPVRLNFEAIKSDVLLLCRNREKRIDTEIRIQSKYLDRRFYDRRRAEIILSRLAKGIASA